MDFTFFRGINLIWGITIQLLKLLIITFFNNEINDGLEHFT